jgi:hypothetical protein
MQANPEGDEMKNWLRRMRGAIGMGVTWAVGWAAFGILIGVSSLLLPGLPWDRFFEVFDAPLPAMAVPGFFAGAIFSAVLAVAGRRKRFDELSLPRFAAWGAVGGLMLSLLPAAMVSVGLATPRAGLNLWGITAAISGPLILLTSLSAAGSLLLARKAEGRKVREVEEGAAAAIGEGGVTTSPFVQSTAKDTTDTKGQARGWPG